MLLGVAKVSADNEPLEWPHRELRVGSRAGRATPVDYDVVSAGTQVDVLPLDVPSLASVETRPPNRRLLLPASFLRTRF
jgi:hypothetical protein